MQNLHKIALFCHFNCSFYTKKCFSTAGKQQINLRISQKSSTFAAGKERKRTMEDAERDGTCG